MTKKRKSDTAPSSSPSLKKAAKSDSTAASSGKQVVLHAGKATDMEVAKKQRTRGFLAVQTNSAPAGLDPAVIARMEPADRMMLASPLEKYLDAASSQPRTIDAAGPQGL